MSKQRIENLMRTFKISLKDAKKVDEILTLIRKERDYETLNNGMGIIDGIIGGYGVEHIMTPEFEPLATYVNKGDTYVNTVLVTANYYPLICCWGDYAYGKRTL